MKPVGTATVHLGLASVDGLFYMYIWGFLSKAGVRSDSAPWVISKLSDIVGTVVIVGILLLHYVCTSVSNYNHGIS